MTPQDTMTSQRQIIAQQMAKTLAMIQDSHENKLIEIRSFKTKEQPKKQKIIIHGYYTDINKCINDICSSEHFNETWYIVLNEIRIDAYKTKLTNNVSQKLNEICTGETTNSADIVRRKWLFIDVDNHLNSDSATNDEKDTTKSAMLYLKEILSRHGFADPIVADSGNGYHLLYRIDLPTTEYVTRELTIFLETLEAINPYSLQHINVDLKVTDLNRLCKLYGCIAKRGQATAERPHRFSYIIEADETPGITELNTIIDFNIQYHNKLKEMRANQ